MLPRSEISTIIERCNLDKKESDELISILYKIKLPNTGAFLKYSQLFSQYHGENYQPNITRESIPSGTLYSIEPCCASTTYVVETPKLLIVVDTGFTCYAKELKNTLISLIPDYETREKVLIITHSDVDHVGLLSDFSKIYLSQLALEDLQKRAQNNITIREYGSVSKYVDRLIDILAKFTLTNLENMHCISTIGINGNKPLTYSQNLTLDTLNFQVFETTGGHAPGSVVLIDSHNHLVFTGDLFVNPDMRPEQKSFIDIAEAVSSSLNDNPIKAKAEFEELFAMLGTKSWILCGGHGGPFKLPGIRKYHQM